MRLRQSSGAGCCDQASGNERWERLVVQVGHRRLSNGGVGSQGAIVAEHQLMIAKGME